MSLQESARRLYKAQYGDAMQESAKTKIITQGLDTVSKGIIEMAKNIDKKLQDDQKKFKKQEKTMLQAVKDDPVAREAFTDMLDREKNIQNEASKMGSRFLVGKEKKKQAAIIKAESDTRIKSYYEDFNMINKILSNQGTYSKANTVFDSANTANIFRLATGKLTKEDFEYREDGVYVTQPSTGEKVRLKDYKTPMYRFDVGIESSGALLSSVGKKYNDKQLKLAQNDLEIQANTMIGNDNFKSLIFDDIGLFNYADENFEGKDPLYMAMGIENIKVEYDENPEFREKVQQDWKADYIAAGVENFNEVHFPEGEGDEVSKKLKEEKTKDTVYSSITRTYIPKKDIKNVKDRVAAGLSATALDGSGVYEPVYEGKPPRKKQLVGYKRFKDKSGDPIEDDKLLKIGSDDLFRVLYAEEPSWSTPK